MFDLAKVEITKYGGLAIAYTGGEDEEPIEYKCKNIAAPHPDLLNLFPCLIPYVAECYGMDKEKIRPIGLEYTSGNGVIVHFVYQAKNGSEVKLVTPRIKLEGDAFGFEAELGAVADSIAYETNEYLNGKRAQMELFDVSNN